MREVYRKWGSVARWENGTVVRVVEKGIATEDGDRFECQPEAGDHLDPIDPERIAAVAATVRELVPPSVDLERLVITEGVATHRVGEFEWSDRSERMHLALVRGQLRALLDLGGFAADEVEQVASVLSRAEQMERPLPARLRIAPRVVAALLPSLAGLAPPNVSLWQTGGKIDGKGNRVEDIVIEHEPWPNWYRPSYRSRPLRRPFDLRLESEVTLIEEDRPLAVAMLGPPQGLVVRVLVQDGERAYPATVRLTRIDAVSRDRVWYPYGAGSFGAEMML